MSVTAQTSFVEYAGNGTTSTGYTITFEYQDAADIAVYVDAVVYTNFSITGGKVYTGTAVAATSEVRIENAVPYSQTLELVEGGDFSSSLSERAWDRAVLMIQQLRDAIGRCLRMKRGATPAEMAEAVNVYPYIDASGNLVSRTAAQVAADVSPELDFTATGDKVTRTCADAAARAALAADFTGQVLIQLDTNNVYISTSTVAGAWSLFGTDVVAVATAAARAAAVPDYYGQLLYQTNTAEFYTAHGLTAGKWIRSFQGPASVVVADAAARAAAAPAFIGQKAYQTDTAAWYNGTSTAAGGWTAITAWAGSTAYTLGDIRSSAGLLWECISTHAASATWNTPGTGAGYQKYWKPWLVDGFHYEMQRAPGGTESTKKVLIGDPDVLPDWSYAINWILVNKLLYNGGGSGNSAWTDKTPYANPANWANATAYVAGDFVLYSSVRYKCHTSHTSATALDRPGTGSAWEDAWIIWAEDPRVIGVIEFFGGTYNCSKNIRVPAGVTLKSDTEGSRRRAKLKAKAGYTDTYLYEGIEIDATNANSSFFTSVLDVDFDPTLLCKAVYWAASHGSVFRSEITNHGRFTPITMARNCDDFILSPRITDTATPTTRSPYGIYFNGTALQGPLAGTILNPVIGQTGVGISFGDVEGVNIIGYECESTTVPVEVRIRDNDAAYAASSWSVGVSDHAIGDRMLHGGARYRCFNTVTNAPAAQEPGVGADWDDYWELIPSSNTQGRCGGLNILGGRWMRHSTDTTHNECATIRADDDDLNGFTMSNVLLDTLGSQTWQHVTVMDLDTSQVHDYPIGLQNLEAVKTRFPADFDLREAQLRGSNTRKAHAAYAGGGSSNAKTVDTRWVSNDNPATFAGNTNEDVTLAQGWYEVEITGTFNSGTITIDDEEGNPLPYFAAVTADKTRRFYHAGGNVNVAMSGSTPTPSVNVYFKPFIY